MSEPSLSPITVLGAGAWGTALALHLARNGQKTTLWGRDPEQIKAIQNNGSNEKYLPGITLPSTLQATSDLAGAIMQSQDILIAVPSRTFRDTLKSIKADLRPDTAITWATKGLDLDSSQLLHQVVNEVLGPDVKTAVLSGPTFASELARGAPTAITLASADSALLQRMSARLHNQQTLRVYTSTDLIGVELGGISKNVIAIAAGISDGLGYGANARAALITRGLAEMIRLGVAAGGQRDTFMGMAGLGDLVLSCTDDQSRNRRLGLALGQGASLESALQSLGFLAEGVYAAHEIILMATRLKIEIPIAEQVHHVLYDQLSPLDAVNRLLEREQRMEQG